MTFRDEYFSKGLLGFLHKIKLSLGQGWSDVLSRVFKVMAICAVAEIAARKEQFVIRKLLLGSEAMLEEIRESGSATAFEILFDSFMILAEYIPEPEVPVFIDTLTHVYDSTTLTPTKSKYLAQLYFKLSNGKNREFLEKALSLINVIEDYDGSMRY